jgi:hypothetical protein
LNENPNHAHEAPIDSRWNELKKLAQESEDWCQYQRDAYRDQTLVTVVQHGLQLTLSWLRQLNGKTVYSLPHRARAVEDANGVVQFYEYKGRKVADA